MTSGIAGERPTPAHQLVIRVRGEYLELPGLRLTLQQAARLFGANITQCEHALKLLVSKRFLKTLGDGSFIRAS